VTRLLVSLLCVASLALAACGGADEPAAPPPQPEPTAQAADFPAADGRTLQDLLSTAEEGPVLAPSVTLLKEGTNRFAFALFDRARKQINGAGVALYVAKQDGTGLAGPFIARSEPLDVAPEFRSQTTTGDEDAAKSVYVAEIEAPAEGDAVVAALVQLDGGLVTTGASPIKIGEDSKVPDVGEKAIKISTETIASSGGDLEMLTTRRPPARKLLEKDFADVLGKQPVVLSFATPLLCASRVCGPVIDIVEQVRASSPPDVVFIQQEIYEDNQVDKGVREQVAAWHLPTEPWTFVIDRDGVVVERFEGAFSPGELQRAVAKVA
jgi:hypothetical protein